MLGENYDNQYLHKHMSHSHINHTRLEHEFNRSGQSFSSHQSFSTQQNLNKNQTDINPYSNFSDV